VRVRVRVGVRVNLSLCGGEGVVARLWWQDHKENPSPLVHTARGRRWQPRGATLCIEASSAAPSPVMRSQKGGQGQHTVRMASASPKHIADQGTLAQ
jgi:hypothetical protein